MFVPTVVNLAIQSCVAISLLHIPNGGIFQKKPRKNITKKAAMAKSGESLLIQEGTSMPTANLTQPGSISKASVFSAITMDNTWIIDTGASNHMIRDSVNYKIFAHHPNKSYLQSMMISPLLQERAPLL